VIVVIWALFITCGVLLTYHLGVAQGHDEEHVRCRHHHG
jgi:hypothetical protein